jgi:hypothetical protein
MNQSCVFFIKGLRGRGNDHICLRATDYITVFGRLALERERAGAKVDLAGQLREEGLLVGAVVLPHVEDHGARDHFHVLTHGSHEFFLKLIF